MKKLSFSLSLFLCTVYLSAFDLLDISGDVGIGYMNYAVVTRYNSDGIKANLISGLKDSLGEGLLKYDDAKTRDIYNALGIGLAVKVSFFYSNLAVGFPFKQLPTGYDPLSSKLQNLEVSNKLSNSVILDWHFGGGLTLFKDTPLNIFLGAGLGLGYIRTSRSLPQKFVDTIKDSNGNVIASSLNEIRSAVMAGLGLNMGIKYFFADHIGLTLDIKNTIYFLPVLNYRYYKGTTLHGRNFTYTITQKKEKDIRSIIKYSWANNFNIRLGLAFKI